MAGLQEFIRDRTNPPVFIISAAVILAFVLWGVIAPGNVGGVAEAITGWISTYFGWWYILAVTAFLIFAVILVLSPWGRIRLGKDDSRPEWRTSHWFAMLFTAGMGIGLVFYGVAEPIFHLNDPPEGQGGTPQAAAQAMNLTFFHWGFHPWAVYIVVGLSMAYFSFRHDLPLRPAAAFYPLIGDRIYGGVGNLVDILAVFGTLFGLATSLGLGASQISEGLAQVFGITAGPVAQVIIIAVITAVACGSVLAGLDRGIRRLSVINLYLAILLAAFVFIVGPTLFILELMVQSTGRYIQTLPATSLQMFTFSEEAQGWFSSWTLFYWGWWIAWSPFVGMFIARISRGRTIRQFILGTLLAPVGASIVWFSTFGGSALHGILRQGSEQLAGAGTTDAMFILMSQLPVFEALSVLASLLAIVVVAIFFATSSDSGSLVIDILTNGGDPNPAWQSRLFWAVTEGAVAAILLVAGAVAGGDALSALQTASIASGLPFSIVLVLMCWGVARGLRQDIIPPRQRGRGRGDISPEAQRQPAGPRDRS